MRKTGFHSILAVLLLFSGHSFSFGQGNVKGRVTSERENFPLPFARVLLKSTGLNQLSTTDTGGYYSFNQIPAGKYKLIVHYIGFDSVYSEISVKNGKTAICNFRMEMVIEDRYIILPEIFITATRTSAYLKDLPGSNRVISSSMIKELPVNNVDELLISQAGIGGDRDKGIFSKNASLTMRGLNGSYRVLVLVDGVPINKSDGGSINWNRISPAFIDRIEISEGPGSAIYGGNAMGGVINIISKEPQKKLEGSVRAMLGTYHTVGSIFKFQGTEVKKNKGFYWGINGFYRQGDGYISEPDSTRDSTNVAVGVKEYTLGGKIGYRFNKYNSLEMEYSWFDDKRLDGTRIYDPEGGYFKYTTNFIHSRYSGGNKKTKIEINTFYQAEGYFNQKESLKREKTPPFPVTSYVLYNTSSDKIDRGIWGNISREVIKNNYITAGIDYKRGSVDGSDIYFTSTDTVTNRGKLDFYAGFIQDEISLWKNKIKIIAGLRLDAATFLDGEFLLGEPTAVSEILLPYSKTYDDTTWYALSPKLAVQYRYNDFFRFYVSMGRGFRPPILDDLCRNGNITKGIKLANPELKPETIDNFEAGGEMIFLNKITLHPAFYYSIGRDFQYFVGTGDSNYSGTKPKPVLKRENISEVHIYGAEINLNYTINNKWIFRLSYAFNHSKIVKYDLTKYTGKDLTGKQLMEVAPSQLYSGLIWRNKYFTTALVFHYIAGRFMDDENLTSVGAHHTFDFKISATSWFCKNLSASLSAQNITNVIYLDNKSQLGLGRYFTAEIIYEF